MSKSLTNVLISLAVILVFFAVVMFVLGARQPQEGATFNFSVDQATVVIRFVFVIIGLLLAFAVSLATWKNAACEVCFCHVVWLAIGSALYAVFSFVFNGI